MDNRLKVAVAAGLAILVVCVALSLSSYGTVSDQTYAFAKALYAVCDRKDDVRLRDAASKIQSAKDNGEISSQEAGWLTEIITEAESGRWQDARKIARTLLASQVTD